ncbi:maleylacetoacetate isomerase [Pseudomonas aeruginosa]|uniref:Maleylpyruvate isomerase n=1 Tax=Pseudomonas putida TaxID=303 RepID=C3VEG9_PSEPU|nr:MULTISPECIES: maleylacetoacetate isomerase [Pseudomonadaceae]ACO92383.1 maleylpyruvate isomerase [Pseudomonas putida]ORL54794.1 maleylacetoacetate isomerase [Pseudomonas aeruginosa]
MNLKLYGYFRSSASYRVRIAMNLKGLAYDQHSIHLSRDGGEQHGEAFRALNPQRLVPVLDSGELKLSQSLAILEYLEERYPQTPLLPADSAGRARVRQLMQLIACDIHPLNNLRVLNYLTGPLALTEQQKLDWIHHWIELGFDALEKQLAADGETARFCHGDTPTLADCCLIPQVFSAHRFGVDMTPYPTLVAIEEACRQLPAFVEAEPGRQPDAS